MLPRLVAIIDSKLARSVGSPKVEATHRLRSLSICLMYTSPALGLKDCRSRLCQFRRRVNKPLFASLARH